ncbi:MAG: hypothetical protein ACOY32_01235 [Thermodesulfobacteriota bacterium]
MALGLIASPAMVAIENNFGWAGEDVSFAMGRISLSGETKRQPLPWIFPI